MLRAVFFDLMGTLVHDPYREALRAATGLDLPEIAEHRNPDCWPAFELGQLDEAEFARAFFRDPDIPFDVDAFNRTRRSQCWMLPGIEDVLRALSSCEPPVELHVASNYPVWIDELRERFELDTWFHGVWASCHLGVRKPDPAFFELLLDKTGHEARHSLFVDDRQDNCEAAAAAGFRVHRFVGAEELAEALRGEGVLR